MLFMPLLPTLLLTTLAAAAPAPDAVLDALAPRDTPLPPPSAFGLVAHAPGRVFDGARIAAKQGGLVLQTTNLDARCGPHSDQTRRFAAFTNKNTDSVYLWDPKTGSKRQQLWCDVSGMGQGVCQYTRDEEQARGLNKNRITTTEFGFRGPGTEESPSELVWRGKTRWIACPRDGKRGSKGPWSVRLAVGGGDNPGGNRNCRRFSARVVQLPGALGCHYTNRESG
ncbi:hypothetical protein B0J12DRAFT_732437 [Macrophomina phaseolina]|uniref:Uncharacterized protein n=1 Tax=Macrophomina phaseolina TaxID=35725 RepID=A0ABQ8FVY6_9PEZI|nr:hypothetical protein B0J12DRAFT_732437 [Macrophomina phaseolina]